MDRLIKVRNTSEMDHECVHPQLPESANRDTGSNLVEDVAMILVQLQKKYENEYFTKFHTAFAC